MEKEGFFLLISHTALIISHKIGFENSESSSFLSHPYLVDISESLRPLVARGADRRESNACRVGNAFALRRFELLVLTDVNEPQHQSKQSNNHTNCSVGCAAGRIVGIMARCTERKRMKTSLVALRNTYQDRSMCRRLTRSCQLRCK